MIYKAPLKIDLFKTALSQIRLFHVALLTIALFALNTPSQAAIVRHLDELKALEAPISRNGLTRIAVQGDRIAHVFGVTGEYVLEADEVQGQIFIRPTESEHLSFQENGVKPQTKSEQIKSNQRHSVQVQPALYLTLTTENGKTQDLRLIPQDQNPEALILKPEAIAQKDSFSQKLTQAPIMREEVEDLIQAACEGRVPLGYKSMPLGLHTLQGPYLLVKELKGEKLRCLIYDVKNRTGTPLVLSEDQFLKQVKPQIDPKQTEAKAKDLMKSSKAHGLISPPPIAVLISKKTLNPGEGAFVYVVIRAL